MAWYIFVKLTLFNLTRYRVDARFALNHCLEKKAEQLPNLTWTNSGKILGLDLYISVAMDYSINIQYIALTTHSVDDLFCFLVQFHVGLSILFRIPPPGQGESHAPVPVREPFRNDMTTA